MKKSVILFLCLFLTSCIGGDAMAALGTATKKPNMVSPYTATPPFDARSMPGEPGIIATGTPDPAFLALKEREISAYETQVEAQKRFAESQLKLADSGIAANKTQEQRQNDYMNSKKTLEAKEVSARLEYSGTITALEATRRAIPVNQEATLAAIEAAIAAAQLKDVEAYSTDTSASKTQSAAFEATQNAQSAAAWGGTATADTLISTQGAPATATIQAGKLEKSQQRQDLGMTLISIVGWSAVILTMTVFVAFTFVILTGKWNKEAVKAQVELAQGSVMRSGDSAIQHDGARWSGIDDVQAPEEAKPVQPIPIYDAKHPAPGKAVVLNDTEKRFLLILKISNELYKDDLTRLAGHRETIKSGSQYDAIIESVRRAGVLIRTDTTGTYLAGQGANRDELGWMIQSGKVRIN